MTEAEIPGEVLWLRMAAELNIPVGASVYDRIITDYPEYFPEETERRKKYDAIPKEVHDAYWREFDKLRTEFYKNTPVSKGIFYWCTHKDEYEEYEKLMAPISKRLDESEAELWQKYYSKYGVEKL